MLILLYGEDTYRSRQKLCEIIDHYRELHRGALNLEYLEGKNIDFKQFKDGLLQSTIFKGKRLIILKNVFGNPGFKEELLNSTDIFLNTKDVILFFEDEEVSDKDQLLVFLEKKGKVQEFKKLGKVQLEKWLKNELEKFHMEADKNVFLKLIDFVGNDLWKMSNEIKKLAAFKNIQNSVKKRIELEDVELMVKPKIETDIFKTIDAIALKNKKQAISFLHKHLEEEDSPLYLLSMINYQFRNLLLVRDLIDKGKPYPTIAKMTKLHPFVLQKTFSQAQKLNRRELKNIYQRILKVDLDIKSGKLDPQTALDLLIAEI